LLFYRVSVGSICNVVRIPNPNRLIDNSVRDTVEVHYFKIELLQKEFETSALRPKIILFASEEQTFEAGSVFMGN
jgi:hypothetical protein